MLHSERKFYTSKISWTYFDFVQFRYNFLLLICGLLCSCNFRSQATTPFGCFGSTCCQCGIKYAGRWHKNSQPGSQSFHLIVTFTILSETNVNVRGNTKPHNQYHVGFYWWAVAAALPLSTKRHKDTVWSDWTPFTHVIRVDKLAAHRKGRKTTWQRCSHFPM